MFVGLGRVGDSTQQHPVLWGQELSFSVGSAEERAILIEQLSVLHMRAAGKAKGVCRLWRGSLSDLSYENCYTVSCC